MIIQGEGTINIAIEDFWEFVKDQEDFRGMGKIIFGYPTIDRNSNTIQVGFAFDTSENPANLKVQPKCLSGV